MKPCPSRATRNSEGIQFPVPSFQFPVAAVAAHYLDPEGSAKAQYTPPDGFPGRSLSPPAAIATNWRPLTSYTAGVALPANGKVASHSRRPVFLSNAWNWRSKLVAPIKTSPPAATAGPP